MLNIYVEHLTSTYLSRSNLGQNPLKVTKPAHSDLPTFHVLVFNIISYTMNTTHFGWDISEGRGSMILVVRGDRTYLVQYDYNNRNSISLISTFLCEIEFTKLYR
jgi:hypothetical protein